MNVFTYKQKGVLLWWPLLALLDWNPVSFFKSTWMNNYIHVKQWDVITHPCPNFNSGLVKPLLKLGHGWVITSHITQWMWLVIHSLILVNSLCPSDARGLYRSGLTLANVVACCLMAPSHSRTNVHLLWNVFCSIHLRAISHEMPKNLIHKMLL